jgi:hypothetical protein
MKQSMETEELNRKQPVDYRRLSIEQANKMADEAMRVGGNKNNLTDQERAKGIASAIMPELAKVLGGIEKGREDASPEKFFKMLETVLKLNSEAGMKSLSNASSALNMTFHKWFNTDGTLGVNDEKNTIDVTRAPHVEAILKDMLNRLDELKEKIITETIAIEKSTKTNKLSASKKRNRRGVNENSVAGRILNEASKTSQNTTQKSTLNSLNKTTKDLATDSQNVIGEIKRSTKATETQTIYDKNANVKQDTDTAKEMKIEQQNTDINRDTAGAVKRDENTGFNTDERADELIDGVKKEKEIKLPEEIIGILQSILSQMMIITGGAKSKRYKVSKKDNTRPSHTSRSFEMDTAYAELEEAFTPVQKSLIALKDSVTASTEAPKALSKSEFDKISLKLAEGTKSSKKVEKSDVYASPIRRTFRDILQNFVNDMTGASKAYKEIVEASSKEQDKMAAERVKIWGMNNGRNPNDTGDIAGMRRILELYRTNKASIEQNPELMQKIKLTAGVKVDTTELTKTLNEALSGNKMRNAQMGGSPAQQILGLMRGFTFMPSLEKSRVQADGLNQILGDINKALNSVLSNIQMHETTLAGMEERGEVKFDDQGYMIKGSSAAKKTLADLEESKYVLETIEADLLANEKIIKRTGSDYGQMIKQLSFTSPILRDDNAILRNLNAGLDKSGKALKFQTRWAEILNYTFQLIGRSIGQWLKKMISLLNPFNILKNTIRTITGWIKRAFQDFGSYDVKWQRTMNVIKINFQRAIKPAMEWIAQKLVNIIGFFNIISMKVQEAFGQIPVDLFDQAGAQSEKIRRELEEAANVTAGFDELHDIGSDNSGANDLLGDIYKPQLSDEWKAMAEEIGDLFAGLIKGEKTVGEVLGRIFEMVVEVLGKIAKKIWDWFKTTAFGKWITEHWKGLLATILAVFLAWKLLKIAGSALFNALFGKLLEKGAITGIFSKLGGWISNGLSFLTGKGGILGFIGSFGQGIITAFSMLFANGKYSLIGTIGEMFTNHAAITQAGSWGSMLGFAITKGLGVALAGAAVMKGFDMVADDASYNIGLKANGGKDEDKKSGLGGKLLGAAGGAALAGLAIGGPIAMGVGAIVGLLVTSLAPAIEDITVKSKEMNNEMQKIEYYEGAVQGCQTQVSELDELMQILNQTLQAQTDKVYKQGEQLGISKTRMDELVKSTQNGTFETSMLSGKELELTDSLVQLSAQQLKNDETTKKLTQAKKKLEKAELDLAIAADIAAGNYELASARIEMALATDVYEGQEAAKKMAQIMKGTDQVTRETLLKDMSPDMKKNWVNYVSTTEQGKKDFIRIYSEMNDAEREAFGQDYASEITDAMQETMDAAQKVISNTTFDWSHPFQSLWSIFSGDWSWKGRVSNLNIPKAATGTNYVASDGLAYIHQGEAIIPKKYNPALGQGMSNEERTYMQQMMTTMRSLDSTMRQGINVNGQFVQRGSDLVAVVNKTKSQTGAELLSNASYAR